MTDVRIATGAEQPINSDGAVSTVTGGEGDLVALDSNGELVSADAQASGNGGAEEPAVGVLTTPVDDPSSYPTGQFEYAAKAAEANREAINDGKVGYVKYGVELVNQDADWGFTPGEPVYLDVGGGFTQTEPSTAGDIQQVVGTAHEAEVVYLDVQPDYDNA